MERVVWRQRGHEHGLLVGRCNFGPGRKGARNQARGQLSIFTREGNERFQEGVRRKGNEIYIDQTDARRTLAFCWLGVELPTAACYLIVDSLLLYSEFEIRALFWFSLAKHWHLWFQMIFICTQEEKYHYPIYIAKADFGFRGFNSKRNIRRISYLSSRDSSISGFDEWG